MFNFPEAQVRPESIHAELLMALISVNAVLLAQQEQALGVSAPPPKRVITLCWEQLNFMQELCFTGNHFVSYKTQTKGL